ncbi:MAG: polyketide cyclase/dehydrase [Bacteroidetes bacterium]|nr:MAG: polyketide cyclase/dehydrase [Bacteroidota bacterium]
MTSINISAQNGKATTIKKTFSRETAISITINSDAKTVWKLLTDASNFPNWNSTVTSIEGQIVKGGKIKLKSILDEKRTFKLKIKEFEPNKRMVWGDRKGNRIYTIEENKRVVTFTMSEKIGGLMFPMYAKYIPPFDEMFQQFANDFKKEAEKINSTK